MSQKPLVQSVERALDILDHVGDSDTPLGSTQLAQKLNLHTSTANNLIRTLYRRGYLSQTADGKYQVGLQCYRLGSTCDRWRILRELARIPMTELSESTGDNSVLASESGGRLITIANVEGSGDIVIANQHLFFDHLYCTAVGKLLMAYSPPEFIEQFRKTRHLDRVTPKTIVDWTSLREEFVQIKASGFSLNRGESLSMVAAIAVPVFDVDGSLLCALGQPFPDYYIETKRVDVAERTGRLTECATAISKAYAEAMRTPKGDKSC